MFNICSTSIHFFTFQNERYSESLVSDRSVSDYGRTQGLDILHLLLGTTKGFQDNRDIGFKLLARFIDYRSVVLAEKVLLEFRMLVYQTIRSQIQMRKIGDGYALYCFT